MGRWRSKTFLEYIREELGSFSDKNVWMFRWPEATEKAARDADCII